MFLCQVGVFEILIMNVVFFQVIVGNENSITSTCGSLLVIIIIFLIPVIISF